MTVRVVVVRPWLDGRGGGGCCGGEVRDGIAPPPLARDAGRDHPTDRAPHVHEHVDPTSEVYRRLRRDHPGIDVQVTPANNVWLLGWSFRAVRRRRGLARAVAAAAVAARPGAVLLEGESIGDLDDDVAALSAAVGARLPQT